MSVFGEVIARVLLHLETLSAALGIAHLDALYESTINSPFLKMAEMTGVPPDLWRLVGVLLMTYPFALIHKNLPNASTKHLFNIVAGLTMLIVCYGPLGWVHVFITSSVCFVLLKVLPTRIAPATIFVGCIAYILCMHAIRMYINWGVYEIDNTTPQMFLIVRLTSLSFNYKDGNIPDSELRDEWKRYKITHFPSMLEYFSFVFYFGGVIVGPAYEFVDFKKFHDGSFYEDCPNKAMPSTYLPAAKRFSHAVVCLVLNLYLTKHFPTDYLYGPDFATQNLAYKWVYSVLALVATRFGYFFTFCLAEGANILNGFGYIRNEDGSIGWDRLASVTIHKVELAQSPRDISSYWNMTVGHWLKHYVYLRAGDIKRPPPGWSVYTTNLLSGLWHGFYPGYFIHFGTAAFLVELARRTRNKIRPLFDKTPLKPLYDVLGIIVIKCMMGYSMACFVGLSWQNNIAYLSSMYYSGHLFLAASMLLVTLWPSKPIIRPLSANNVKPKHN